MSDASFASLGPTLLARKGGAKPAMRPQVGPLSELVADEQLEDLGWNDMGQDEDDQVNGQSADVVSINPSLKHEAVGQDNSTDGAGKESPLVKRQQHELAERIIADIADQALTKSKAPAKRHSVGKTAAKTTKSPRRAAFTLRLDTDRHLKLRLAATMQGVSAQALVTQALDAMLSEIEDLDALATRMKRT